MTEYFTSGLAADVILVVLALELLWLGASRKLPIAEALALILPGALIVVALRGALTGAEWPWIALPLALSFPIHLADLTRRLARSRRA